MYDFCKLSIIAGTALHLFRWGRSVPPVVQSSIFGSDLSHDTEVTGPITCDLPHSAPQGRRRAHYSLVLWGGRAAPGRATHFPLGLITGCLRIRPLGLRLPAATMTAESRSAGVVAILVGRRGSRCFILLISIISGASIWTDARGQTQHCRANQLGLAFNVQRMAPSLPTKLPDKLAPGWGRKPNTPRWSGILSIGTVLVVLYLGANLQNITSSTCDVSRHQPYSV